MNYKEKSSLAKNVSSPTGGWEMEPLPHGDTLLIGGEPIYSWTENVDRCGGWNYWIFPAVYNGKKSWLIRRRWFAGEGFSSGNDGKSEEIIDFEKGASFLLSHDAFEWIFPKN